MIKKIGVLILMFCVITVATTKILIHGVLFRGLESQKSVIYLPPEHETSLPLAFNGIEVNLPWSKINNVIAMYSSVVFIAEGDKRFNIMRLPTPTQAKASKELGAATHMWLLHANTYEEIRDKVEIYFLGDLGPLINHPELIDQMYYARPSNVTWQSNPFSDIRTAVGLILRFILDGFHDTYEVENHDMRGYHEQKDSNGQHVDVYYLGMKDGSCNVNFMMINGSQEYAAYVLGSLRVIKVPADFSRAAFETSKKLALSSHGDKTAEKLAVLTAIEAASNTSPNLNYFTQVLDLCQKFHFDTMGRSWLSASFHYFPASISKLMTRYQEFDKKKTLLAPVTIAR